LESAKKQDRTGWHVKVLLKALLSSISRSHSGLRAFSKVKRTIKSMILAFIFSCFLFDVFPVFIIENIMHILYKKDVKKL
jgi:hypothetical protein